MSKLDKLRYGWIDNPRLNGDDESARKVFTVAARRVCLFSRIDASQLYFYYIFINTKKSKYVQMCVT